MAIANIKMFLFGKWITTLHPHYPQKHSDEWWEKKIKYFNKKIYPKYITNGTVEDTLKFFGRKNTLDIDRKKPYKYLDK